MIIRRIFYLLFLIVLACSKDKDEEPEYVLKNYEVSVEANEGGTVSYAGGYDDGYIGQFRQKYPNKQGLESPVRACLGSIYDD